MHFSKRFPSQNWNHLRFLLAGMMVLVATSGCQLIEQRLVYGSKGKLQILVKSPSPDELDGLNFQNVFFDASDGTRLNGWLIEPETGAEHHILFAHGRSSNVAKLKQPLLEFVRRHQVSVFVFDYRGFGKSQGRPNEQALYQDAADAKAWFSTATQTAGNDIIVMGRSLGAAVAIDLAAHQNVKGLIVECGFTSVKDVVRHHVNSDSLNRFVHTEYNSIEKIGNCSAPIFICHGTQDKIIPFGHGLQLTEVAAAAGDVQFYQFEGGHKMLPNESYSAAIQDFLDYLAADQ